MKNQLNLMSALVMTLLASAQATVAQAGSSRFSLGRTKKESRTRQHFEGGFGNRPTRFDVPHGGGAREVARRQRQLAKGMIRASV